MLHRRFAPLLILLLSPLARANMPVPSLLDLAKESDLVVTGKVLQVDEKTATIQIDAVIAGACDAKTIVITPNTVISDIGPPYVYYKPGDIVLLYLKKNADSSPATVAGKGFGKRAFLPTERDTEVTAASRVMQIAALKSDDAVNRAMLADVTSPNPLLKRDACYYISISTTFNKNTSDYAKELKALLSDKDPKVLQSALFTLRAVDCSDILPRLIEFTHNSDAAVVQCAAMALGRYLTPEVTAALEALTKHSEVAVRERALAELGNNRHDAAKPAMAASLHDKDAGVRAAACTSLTNLLQDGKADDLIPQIAPLMEDQEYVVASSAALALGLTHNVAAVEPLISALETKRITHDVQYLVLQSLYNHLLNDKDAPPAIEKQTKLFLSILKNDASNSGFSPALQTLAILSRTTQPEAKAALQWAAESHPNPEVRAAAALYLKNKN